MAITHKHVLDQFRKIDLHEVSIVQPPTWNALLPQLVRRMTANPYIQTSRWSVDDMTSFDTRNKETQDVALPLWHLLQQHPILSYLDLFMFNGVNENTMQAMAHAICKQTRLRHLRLSHVPMDIFMDKLLQCTQAPIKSLRRLALRYSYAWTLESVYKLTELFGTAWPNLERIELHCPHSTTTKWLEHMFHAFANCNKLTALNFGCAQQSAHDEQLLYQQLPQWITNLKHLSTLCLSHLNHEPRCLNVFASVMDHLSRLPQLTHLELHSCVFERSPYAVFPILPGLHTLLLSMCTFAPTLPDEPSFFVHVPALEEFHMCTSTHNGCWLRPVDITTLCTDCPLIQLHCNALSTEQFELLNSLLPQTQLQSLQLFECRLRSTRPLEDLLTTSLSMPRLNKLELFDNLYGVSSYDNVMAWHPPAGKMQHTLQHLQLSDFHILRVQDIVSAFANLVALHCKIEQNGTNWITVIQQLPHLRVASFRPNATEWEGDYDFWTKLVAHPSLRIWHTCGRAWSYSSEQCAKWALDQHPLSPLSSIITNTPNKLIEALLHWRRVRHTVHRASWTQLAMAFVWTGTLAQHPLAACFLPWLPTLSDMLRTTDVVFRFTWTDLCECEYVCAYRIGKRARSDVS